MKSTLLFFFLFLAAMVSAQPGFRFADSTAQWNVLEEQYYMPGYSLLTYQYFAEGDTIANGIQYQKIQCPGGSGFGFYPSCIAFLRKDSIGRVYRRTNEDAVDVLIYDFGVAKNDTIILPLWEWGGYSPISCVVQNIDTVLIGTYRKRMFVQYIKNSSWSNDVWIEGIGAIASHWMAPGMERGVSDGPSDTLLCFYESDTLRYNAPGHNSCDVNYTSWTSLNDQLLLQAVTIRTNSGSHSVEVCYPAYFSNTNTLLLYDLKGRLILQKELTEQTTRIDVNGVTRGVYLYIVQTNGRAIKNGKLIIE